MLKCVQLERCVTQGIEGGALQLSLPDVRVQTLLEAVVQTNNMLGHCFDVCAIGLYPHVLHLTQV